MLNGFSTKMMYTALAMTALAAQLLATPVYAQSCKLAYTQTVGAQQTQGAARGMAQALWVGKARGQYGLAWSLWNEARYKSLSCTQNGGNSWICVAKAKPCKHVVF